MNPRQGFNHHRPAGRLVVVPIGATVLSLLAACGTPTPLPDTPLAPSPTYAIAITPSAPRASTQTPKSVVTSEPLLGPEQPAVSGEQVVGTWRMRLAGGGGGDPADFTLKPDGTWSMDGVGGYHEGMNLAAGTYGFDGDVFSMTSDACLDISSGSQVFYTCAATYHVFVAMADGRPGSVRFVVIQDPYQDRRNSMNNKTLRPASLP